MDKYEAAKKIVQRYQINVTVKEGRYFPIKNADAKIKISIGKKKRTIHPKSFKTDSPYYNEFCSFAFLSTFSDLISKILVFKVCEMTFGSKKVLGTFKVELATVWAQPNHRFHNKWATLVNPKNMHEGLKGFLKCDISILTKGVVAGPPEKSDINEDDLEENLMVPHGAIKDSFRTRLVFSLFRADSFSPDFEYFHPSKFFIQITHCGVKLKSRMSEETDEPLWNQEIIFNNLEPSLCRYVRIEVFKSSKKTKTFSVLGNTTIDLNYSCADELGGFFPTLGPCFVYLYSPLSKTKEFKEEGIMQNSFTYCCRLLMALRTEVVTFEDIVSRRANKKKKKFELQSGHIIPIVEKAYFKYKKFVLFGVIFDALFFDKNITERNLSVKLTIGPKINTKPLRHPKALKKLPMNPDSSEEPTLLTISTLCNTTEPPRKLKFKSDYCFMAFTGNFPCMHVYGEWPNSLRKIYRANVIKKAIQNYTDEFKKAKYALEFEKEKRAELSEKLKIILTKFSKSCEVILLLTKVITQEDTNLCREKKRVYHKELLEIVNSTKLASTKNELLAEDELIKLSNYITKLKKYAKDPENSYPDTEIWIYKNQRKISQVRVRTEDITYSHNFMECGKLSGKIQTIVVRGSHEKIKGKLDIFLWFGLAEDFVKCLEMLPSGYDPKFCKKFFDIDIPKDLTYVEFHKFQCRLHIYQAKIFFGFNKNGLADPFTRAIVVGESRNTKVKKGTLNPLWKETLIFSKLQLFGPLNYIKQNSITVIVEVFDQYKTNKANLIGRSFVKPVVTLSSDKELVTVSQPKLKWEEIQRELKSVGKILVLAELEQLDEDASVDTKEISRGIPLEILPRTTNCRVEVYFWGIRQVKKKKILNKKIFMTLEIAETKIKSPIIKSIQRTPNFPANVKTFEIELPEEPEYTPPLTFKLYTANFITKKKRYIASCFLPNIRRYYYHFPVKVEDTKLSLVEEDNLQKVDKRNIFYKIFFPFILPFLAIKMIFVKLVEGLRNHFSQYHYCKGNWFLTLKKCQNVVHEHNPGIDDETFGWWVRYYKSLEGDLDDREVTPIKIYEEELEAQPEFRGFNDFLLTFDLVTNATFHNEGLPMAQLKAALKIYQWSKDISPQSDIIFPTPNISVKYVVRVYIVSGKNLAAKDLIRNSDPYIRIKLGNQKISDKENYASHELNPTFGKCFELRGTFPFQHLLTVQVCDYDTASANDLIGETTIDLENRFYTKHYARCGLSLKYEKEGACAWRDIFSPSYILRKTCNELGMKQPVYEENQVIIEQHTFETDFPSDISHKEQHQALAVLHNWHEMDPKGFHLVPEHVETRSLYHPSMPDIEQGKLEMWVDIFPEDYQYLPPKVDITPQPPVPIELRAIVWNVDNVILDDKSFFFSEKMSDIYVKGWILSLEEELQKTDVHYRSLNGEGNFNWRFIFRFDYVPGERMIVVKKKPTAFHKYPEARKHRCKLEIQIWDNDAFGDDYLGTLILELSAMPRGAKLSNRCTLKMLAPTESRINLFKIGRTRGWWPFRRIKAQQAVGNEFEMVGKIDLELEVLTEKDASLYPAGKGRDNPQGLPEPLRPATSFNWMLNPLKTLRFIVWKKFRKWLIMLVLLGLLVLYVMVAIYAIPNYTIKRLINP